MTGEARRRSAGLFLLCCRLFARTRLAEQDRDTDQPPPKLPARSGRTTMGTARKRRSATTKCESVRAVPKRTRRNNRPSQSARSDHSSRRSIPASILARARSENRSPGTAGVSAGLCETAARVRTPGIAAAVRGPTNVPSAGFVTGGSSSAGCVTAESVAAVGWAASPLASSNDFMASL